jgi:CheY-like chemotaxis protein
MESVNPVTRESNNKLKGIKILVAEDNTMNRMVVGKFLHSWGADFTAAVNGYEALEKFKSEKFDLVLMDIEMPVMNGYKAVSEIRKIGFSTPVLAFTSLQHSNILCNLKNNGFDDMVLKPFNPADLLIRIQHLITTHKGL